MLGRQSRVEGRPLAWAAATVGGGQAGQYAVEEELVRVGLDRAILGREAFAARAEEQEDAGRARLGALASGLGLQLDVEDATAAGEQACRAARTAFVRLFDEGLVVEADRIVDVCPRCATVVSAADAGPADIEADLLTLRMPLVDDGEGAGHLEVRCMAPELLPGAVAVAVPEAHPAAGRHASVPLASVVVPVVADASTGEPAFVVAAHDAIAFDLAQRLGLAAVPVLDATGTVRIPGALDGLARYAARTAARQLLDAERVVGYVEAALETAGQCLACGTVLVPQLGRHWFLAMGELAPAAADAVRHGQLGMPQAAAREELLRQAAAGGEWCLTRQLWTGEPIPVSRCRDCGHVDVSVAPTTSCGRCMGDLEASTEVLDARFVRCAWPLAACGWPDGGRSFGAEGGPSSALLVVAPDDLPDVLAMVALGLRLCGDVPFGEVVVAPAPSPEPVHAEASSLLDVLALLDQEGRAVLRVALTCGGLDLVAARQIVGWLDAVPAGATDVDRLVESCAAAFASAAPAAALGMLANALSQGVPPDRAARVRALAVPFLGG